MDVLAATKIYGLPSFVVGIAAFVIVIIAAWLGLVLGRRTGKRAIASRMAALGARLGSDGPGPDASLEEGLTYLEQVTGAATEAVTSQAADALRLRRALDTLPEGVIICDESGVVLYRNGRASELMTSRSGDALAAQAVTDLLQEAWTSGDAEKVLELFGPPRSTLSIRAQLIDDGRRPVGVVALIEDISERRRLDEVRRDFIANVSHELKTPMGALGLLAETLMVERDKDVATRLADRIHREAFRVSRIIDDLLDLSRIESEISPPREPVQVGLVMAEAAERIRSSAEQRDIDIDMEEPDADLVVLGDRRQLVSAVHALLENAVTYSSPGDAVTLKANLDPTVIEADQGGLEVPCDQVRLSVIDQGVGIPSRDLDRIFERFYRVDLGRSRET
ncbi:MAG: histidine kinase dimerization/phospho-acceptor domain-containing protein, partial [Actinomycetes bacterium]